MCNRRWRVLVYVESIYTMLFDQIPKLQNIFTTPNKNLGEGSVPQIDKHLPPITSTDIIFFKANI
jgi:hypothetical protein